MLSLFQLETEYLRLREQWLRASAAGEAIAREQLQLRYDIFVSRVGLLQTDRAQRVMVGSADYQHAARDARLRRPLPTSSSGTPRRRRSAAALRRCWPTSKRSTHRSTHVAGAAHRVAQQVTQRNDAMRQHNRVGCC